MHKVKKSLEIKAPVERVFEFMTTPTNFPSVWPSMVEVSNVQAKAGGWHSFDWVYKMAGVKIHGHAAPQKVETNKFIEMRNESGVPSTFRWTYEAKGTSTVLTIEVEYDIPSTLLGKVAEAILVKVNEHEMDTLLKNVKTTLELTTRLQPKDQGSLHATH